MEEASHAGTAKPLEEQPRFQRRRSERIRRRKELREGGGNARRGVEGRNPLAALVEVGDELRARARRLLQARGREPRHGMMMRGRRQEGLGRRNSLAFGNFLAAREEEREREEEMLSAETLAVRKPACCLFVRSSWEDLSCSFVFCRLSAAAAVVLNPSLTR